MQPLLDAHAIVRFTADELYSRSRRGGPKDTPPPPDLWPNILPTLHIADCCRAAIGMPIRVVSAYRTPAYNRLVSGSPTSQHVQFRALDLTCDDLERLFEVAEGMLDWLDARGVPTGLGRYDTFIHIDVGAPGTWRRRWDHRTTGR